MSVTGGAGSAPLRVGYPVADTTGGMTAAFALVAALLKRERTGHGEFIDVSMLESTVAAMEGARRLPVAKETMHAPPPGAFATADGLLNIAANEQGQFESLCDLVGRPELKSDPRFAEREERKRRRAELKPELEAALAGRRASEWAALFN